MMRYPWSCMYLAAKKLGRCQFADRPTTGGLTTTVREAEVEPPEFVAVSVTVYVPGAVKVYDGFRFALVPPSPKDHDHDVGEPVDIVDCFRKSEEMVPIAQAAVANGARVLWMQLGVINEQAARIAIDAGMAVVMNRCVKIEHARLMGGLNWAGVNTGVISAKRLA